MNIYKTFHGSILEAIESLQVKGLIKNSFDLSNTITQPPRNPNDGDIASNSALVLSKQVGLDPMKLAQLIIDNFQEPFPIKSIKAAKPGFINIELNDNYWLKLIQEPFEWPNIGDGQKVLVEFVSANPTGPLHIGHTRGAVYGDVLSNLLSAVGYEVDKEYYVNDAGNQINLLKRSVAAVQEGKPVPDDGYQGEYIHDLAESNEDPVKMVTKVIKSDLADLGIIFDSFVSEAKIIDQPGNVLDILESSGLTYKDGDALIFNSTSFGDDKDRVLIKSNGELTYFIGDLYYHCDKVSRGYNKLINVWGADHGGYVKRLVSAVKTFNPNIDIDVELMQLVHFMRDGKPIKMSKRQATYITLREVLDEVGADALRFLLLSQTNGKDIQFDLDKAIEKSMDNPLWYVQYAHTRICSLDRQLNDYPDLDEAFYDTIEKIDSIEPKELELLKKINQWQYVVSLAAKNHEPHRIVTYLYEIAGIFHSVWASSRFIMPDDVDTSCFRLHLAFATQKIIVSGLDIIGIEPLEKM